MEITTSEAIDIIASVPAIDAVQVVRCGQCSYCAHQKGRSEAEWICVEPHNYCDCGAKIVSPEHFCAYHRLREAVAVDSTISVCTEP